MHMPLSRLLAALADPSFSLADLQSQAPRLIVGFLLLVAGLAAVALFFFRRQSRELTLIYFSLFTTSYAVRLLLHLSVVRSLSSVSDSLQGHIDRWITFVLVIPFLLFLRQILGPHAERFLRLALVVEAIFAVAAISADLFGVGRDLAGTVNNYLVLVIVGGLLVSRLVSRLRGLAPPWTAELRVLDLGLLVFSGFVLEGNLASLGLWHGPDTEAFGFLFFVACLGYVAAHRTFANEHRLLAIDSELAVARQIQSSILPRAVPVLPGTEIAARYLPMSAVAGDFYDFLVLGNNQL